MSPRAAAHSTPTTSPPRRLLLVAVTLLAAFGALLATAGPAAADRSCTGRIGAVTIDDNVRVPADATCTLDGTRVEGNVLVGPRARLNVINGARIDGNIQDDNGNAGHVAVSRSQVLGNIQLEQGTSATIVQTFVDGDLQLESNRGFLRADFNRIDGNLQANQNRGGLTINDNTIDGNLQCQSNSPAPTGGGNIVRGSAESQCSGFTGTPSRFTDVPTSSTHGRSINWLAREGIARGCAPERYCPERRVTRAQMATFLTQALGLPSGSVSGLRDVSPSDTHAAGIGAIRAAGITQGCAPGAFCPNERVTRAQMASFLQSALSGR